MSAIMPPYCKENGQRMTFASFATSRAVLPVSSSHCTLAPVIVWMRTLITSASRSCTTCLHQELDDLESAPSRCEMQRSSPTHIPSIEFDPCLDNTDHFNNILT